MTVTKLKLVSETREQRIERCLKAMGDVVTDLSIPMPTRKAVWRGYAALHACRSPETVRRLEQQQGLSE